ncbi:MAG TPA: FAD-dependent oxidoreductase, partial [Acidimicrobiales bacterium]
TARALSRLSRFDPAPYADRTVDDWIAEQRLPADAAALVRMLVRISTYTDAPDQLSAGAGIAQAAVGLAGVTYLDGGWQRIVDDLSAAASAAGVEIRHHTPAQTVVRAAAGWAVEAGTGTGTTTDRVDAVILAGLSPAAAARLLDATPADLGWDVLGPPVRASCLDLGVRRPATFATLFAVDEPLYLSTHAPPADLAPEGMGVVHLLRYLAPGENPDATVTRAQLEAHAALAGLRPDDIVEQRYLHRMTVAHALPLASAGGLAGRPPVAVRERPGVFVAGDWVGAEGLLADASVSSARAAAAAAVSRAAVVAR